MSAPRTNIEKQARQHRGPLWGMILAVVFAVVLIGALGAYYFWVGNDPGAETTIDGRTGAVLQE